MEIEKEVVTDALIIIPQSKIENDSAMPFQIYALAEIENTPELSVVVDLAKVAFISSAGLRVFLSIAKRLQKEERKFCLCGMNKFVSQIFMLSGFDKVISSYASREEAISPKA